MIIQHLLPLDLIVLEHPSGTGKALAAFESGKGDFSDYLIGNISQENGCTASRTFDKIIREKNLFTQKRSK